MRLAFVAAFSHPSQKLFDGSHAANDNISDGESTGVGSDLDVIDLIDASERELQNVPELENKMEIEFEEPQPPPPQKPKGFYKAKRDDSEPERLPSRLAKPGSWRESVERDLAIVLRCTYSRHSFNS